MKECIVGDTGVLRVAVASRTTDWTAICYIVWPMWANECACIHETPDCHLSFAEAARVSSSRGIMLLWPGSATCFEKSVKSIDRMSAHA